MVDEARGGDSIPRRRHKIPSVVAEESTILLGHSLETVGILERRESASTC
jgi:hypothetical protein